MLGYIIIPLVFLVILVAILIISDLSDEHNNRILLKILDFHKKNNDSLLRAIITYLKHKRVKEIRENKIYYLMSDTTLKELYLTDKEINSMNKLNNTYQRCINLIHDLDFKFKKLEEYISLANVFLEEPTSVNHIELNIKKLEKLYNKIEEQHYINYKKKKEEKRKKELNSIFAKDNKRKFMSILGLNDNTELDLKILKKQYRLLSMKYHPDKFMNVNSEVERKKINDRFVEINNAYEYLLNNYV